MQPMWLCIFSSRQFEDTFENAQWRKVKQMQPMWLCIFSGRKFEATLENTQWRKVKQMHPMWLCILLGRLFRRYIWKHTVEKSQTNVWEVTFCWHLYFVAMVQESVVQKHQIFHTKCAKVAPNLCMLVGKKKHETKSKKITRIVWFEENAHR